MLWLSGGTLHFCGEHTERYTGRIFHLRRFFSPLEKVDARRQVIKLISPNNTVVGSTELDRQETSNSLLKECQCSRFRVHRDMRKRTFDGKVAKPTTPRRQSETRHWRLSVQGLLLS